MMVDIGEPVELRISYAPEFSLEFALVEAERAVSVGQIDGRFKVQCVIRHFAGQFTYGADDIYTPISAFESFRDELNRIRTGTGTRATLADDGEMVSFSLHFEGRKLRSSIAIEEFQAGHESTTLQAGFIVEYDLFVNKLYEDLNAFIKELHKVSPDHK